VAIWATRANDLSQAWEQPGPPKIVGKMEGKSGELEGFNGRHLKNMATHSGPFRV